MAIASWNKVSADGKRIIYAYMDAVATRPDKVSQFMDITVRCPHAARYLFTDCMNASAIQKAENEKKPAYPDKEGRFVTPLAMETYGRCSRVLEELICEVAGDTAARQRDRGMRASNTAAPLRE